MYPYGHMCERFPFHPYFVPVLHSTMGVGPRGYGVVVEKVDGDEEGVYRLQFRNTVTGEIEEVTPNLFPDIAVVPSVYICNHDFSIVREDDTYTAQSSWFVQDTSDIKVDDTVIFGGLIEDQDQNQHHVVCAGVVTSVSFPNITFKSYLESDTGQSTAYIVDGSIVTNKLNDGAVTTSKISDGAVTTPKIVDNAVTSGKIADGAVGTADLANNAVTTPKIANNAVTSDKIADGSVGTADLADDSVTWDKIDTTTVPTMSSTTPGIAKVGNGLVMNNGAIEIDPDVINTTGGVVLFSDVYANTYNLETITLSDSAANYRRIFIEFEDSASRRGSIILDEPDNSFFEMFTIGGNAAAGAIMRFKSMHLEGTVIRIEISPNNQLRNYGVAKIASNGTSSYEDASQIGIIRVIGFK